MQPVTRYAKSGDVHIAYQVFGEGQVNLVFVPGFVSNIELYWDEPDLARALLRLASYARVVMFDKRGTGMSGHALKHSGASGSTRTTRAVNLGLGNGRARPIVNVSVSSSPATARCLISTVSLRSVFGMRNSNGGNNPTRWGMRDVH
jgi:pimeloyl-ACP methyl ester carboxylesterase